MQLHINTREIKLNCRFNRHKSRDIILLGLMQAVITRLQFMRLHFGHKIWFRRTLRKCQWVIYIIFNFAVGNYNCIVYAVKLFVCLQSWTVNCCCFWARSYIRILLVLYACSVEPRRRRFVGWLVGTSRYPVNGRWPRPAATRQLELPLRQTNVKILALVSAGRRYRCRNAKPPLIADCSRLLYARNW